MSRGKKKKSCLIETLPSLSYVFGQFNCQALVREFKADISVSDNSLTEVNIKRGVLTTLE